MKVTQILKKKYGIESTPDSVVKCLSCHRNTFLVNENDLYGECQCKLCGATIVAPHNRDNLNDKEVTAHGRQ